ncbi:type IV pilus modification protein PilV [Noviherbaspirillum sp. ST9]|uniref:type IV pilus modification protein PilV n=1 Tax=Noviherbaspirillum sp. ST9 TaxID=3401606 RepID=UPI003B5879C8
MRPAFHPAQRGTSMIEVLVTIVILTFGLLGLVGMQSRLQLSQMDAYQRAQALVLLDDMASRMANNRETATLPSYVTNGSVLGTGHTCSISSGSTRQQRDVCEWSNALQGAAETSGSSRIGAMAGARGCIEPVVGTSNYRVIVAWQGMGPTVVPANDCGAGEYKNTQGSTDERFRRTISTIVSIGTLTGN